MPLVRLKGTKHLRLHMDGLIFFGNPPMLPTGYAKQLKHLQSFLKGKYEMAHISDWGYEGPPFDYNGVKVYGVSEYPGVITSQHIQECVQNFLEESNVDRWCIVALGNMSKYSVLAGFPTIGICPVETRPLSDSELEGISSVSPVALNKHGIETMQMNGFDVYQNPISHVVDFETLPSKSSLALRSTIKWPFNNTNMFVTGFFGDLTKRKRPDLATLAWSKFSQGKSDVALWVHHSNHISMENNELANFSALGAHITNTNHGWSDKRMMEVLKSIDCLLHPSDVEAFGVLQIEAQAVGTPIISLASEINYNLYPPLVVPSNTGNNRIVDEIVSRLEFLYSSWKNKDYEVNTSVGTSAASDFSFDWGFKDLENMIEYHLKQYFPPIFESKPKKLKHLCLITTWEQDCGIATYSKMLVDQLKNKYQITVLAETDGAFNAEPISKDGIKVFNCWNRHYSSGGSLKGIIDALSPDLIHIQHESNLYKMQTDLLEHLYDVNAKIVSTLHTPDFNNKSVVEFASQCDLVMIHNEPLARSISGSLPASIQYIPHGVQEFTTTHHREESGVPMSIPLLFNYGFCSPTKGILELIQACKMLKQNRLLDSNGDILTTTHFEVVIYAGVKPGQESYFERCLAEANGVDGLTISNQVLSEETIDFWASICDYTVFPYSPSGHPFRINSTSGALMRVLHGGKPVIATDEGRLRDIIGGVHGFKSGKGSPESLAFAIYHAINQFNFNKRGYNAMSQSVSELASRFAWPRVGKTHEKAYQQLCSIYHYRTKTSIEKPISKTKEVSLFLENDFEQEVAGEEE